MKLVTVEWLDAFSPATVWVRPDDIPDTTPAKAIMQATGYLVKQIESGIWLAMLHDPEDGKVGQIFFIPTGMILNTRELE